MARVIRKRRKHIWNGLNSLWFVGKGPRPNYGRWTYWEKFDYLAVFCGVAIIGFSGLVLWFPVFFTRFIPGWVVNVCQIIHSDEALLAVGFLALSIGVILVAFIIYSFLHG